MFWATVRRSGVDIQGSDGSSWHAQSIRDWDGESLAAQINAGADVEAKVQEAVRKERERVRLAMEAYYHPQRIPSWLSEILDRQKGGAE
jgi:hypothetical protein